MEYELWTKSEAYRVPDVAAHMYVAPTFGERPAHLETFQHGAPVGIDTSAAAHVVWMPGDWQVFFTHMIRRMCMIAPFIRWLDDVGMVDFGLVTEATDAGFDTRFRIQKYVFVAQRLGLGTAYRHNRYRYGPY